jgi:DNA-binding GntR family transcriptional regulator
MIIPNIEIEHKNYVHKKFNLTCIYYVCIKNLICIQELKRKVENTNGNEEQKTILDDLRKRIVRLEIQPEEILNLSELAKQYKVSRTPIKETCLILESEGWLLRNGTQFMVTPLSMDRMREISELRSIVEVQAYVWALRRMSGDELQELRKLKQDILKIGEIADYYTMFDLELRFHLLIHQAVHNTTVKNLLDKCLNHYTRYWLSKKPHITYKTFFKSPLEMIQAFEDRNEARIRKLVVEHLNMSVEEITRIQINNEL